MLRRLEKGLTSAKSAAAQPQHQSPSQQQSHNSANGESSSSRPYAGTSGTRERSHSTNTAANFASPTNPSGWNGSPSMSSHQTPGGSSTSNGGSLQYIQIPEYQQQQQQQAAAMTSPASSIHAPSASGGGGSMTHSPPMSRKRRSRSPNMMDEDRYGHHSHPPHRTGTLTSNVRGTEDGEDSENDDLGSESPSEEESKPDANASSDYSMFPANLLAEEKRTSFFKTILNPSGPGGGGSAHGGSGGTGSEKSAGGGPAHASGGGPSRKRDLTSSPEVSGRDAGANGTNGPEQKHFFGQKKPPPTFDDPITMGLITEDEAKTLFEVFFLRLNPFICLFDPVLHTVEHVRSTCPFLFTCLVMAGCKFWKPHLYPACQQLAADTCVKVFQHGVKSVGVVQAFACMTYWKEPDDNNVWMYIGYACRMAVELGMNRYVPKPPEGETDDQFRERRDRERTYLVLWVHDRSLAMQTGRHWMLPEDDLVKNSPSWHLSKFIRPEDVIVAAFVQLRRIAAETTDVFYLHKGQPGMLYADVNYEILLRGCNAKLTAWSNTWQQELVKADGQSFHQSTLSFFRLHVRLFLNSFGLQSSMQTASREAPSLQALSNCYTSALQSLEIVTAEFAPIGMLRYVQDSITVMTAYSAVFLLRLLRHSSTLSDLHDEATRKIYDLISQTADVYQEAALMATSSGSAGYHARFLRSLVAKDLADKAREAKRRAHKSRDGESVSGSSANAPSPSLLPSPTNIIPSYHPPAPPQAMQNQYNGGEQHNGAAVTSPSATDTPNPFVIPSGQNPYSQGSSAQAMIGDSSLNGNGGNSSGGGQDMQASFTNALSAPMHLQDQSFQFSNYSRPQQGSGGPGLSNALDFQQYAPNSPWDPSNPSLADAFGQPEYQQLNGVSDADINYWRHMFVNLGFNSG